jgi:HEPN domain-containing protein
MTAATAEWVEKAEGDFNTAQRELRARKRPNYDAACFHAQQCAEKYLKARLQESSLRFAKTHDLVRLLDLLLPSLPSIGLLRPRLSGLNIYAVEIRYPSDFATKAQAKQAVIDCGEVRKAIRLALRLRTK